MSLFVIADLHLSLNGEKPMDVFRGWHNYVAVSYTHLDVYKRQKEGGRRGGDSTPPK